MREFSGLGFREAVCQEDFPKDGEFFVVHTFHMQVSSHNQMIDVPLVRTWIFTDEYEMEKCVKQVLNSNTDFVFYRVASGLGSITTETKINVRIP